MQRFAFLPGDFKNLVPNLKWGINDEPIRAYLRSVVRLIVCEARAHGVQTAEFKWSYPLSLPDGPRKAMQNFWTVLQNDFSSDGMTVSLAGNLACVSESEAAGRAIAFFPEGPAGPLSPGLCIVMDIGGGSTDFAFWQQGRLLDYLSCKLAANDVLRGAWPGIYPSFLDDIYRLSTGRPLPAGSAIPTDDKTDNYPKKVEVWVNHVLSLAESDQRVMFHDNAGWMSHPATQRIFGGNPLAQPIGGIRALAYILFAGLHYLAGLPLETGAVLAMSI